MYISLLDGYYEIENHLLEKIPLLYDCVNDTGTKYLSKLDVSLNIFSNICDIIRDINVIDEYNVCDLVELVKAVDYLNMTEEYGVLCKKINNTLDNKYGQLALDYKLNGNLDIPELNILSDYIKLDIIGYIRCLCSYESYVYYVYNNAIIRYTKIENNYIKLYDNVEGNITHIAVNVVQYNWQKYLITYDICESICLITLNDEGMVYYNNVLFKKNIKDIYTREGGDIYLISNNNDVIRLEFSAYVCTWTSEEIRSINVKIDIYKYRQRATLLETLTDYKYKTKHITNITP